MRRVISPAAADMLHTSPHVCCRTRTAMAASRRGPPLARSGRPCAWGRLRARRPSAASGGTARRALCGNGPAGDCLRARNAV